MISFDVWWVSKVLYASCTKKCQQVQDVQGENQKVEGETRRRNTGDGSWSLVPNYWSILPKPLWCWTNNRELFWSSIGGDEEQGMVPWESSLAMFYKEKVSSKPQYTLGGSAVCENPVEHNPPLEEYIPELVYIHALENHNVAYKEALSNIDDGDAQSGGEVDEGMEVQMFGDGDDAVEIHNPIGLPLKM